MPVRRQQFHRREELRRRAAGGVVTLPPDPVSRGHYQVAGHLTLDLRRCRFRRASGSRHRASPSRRAWQAAALTRQIRRRGPARVDSAFTRPLTVSLTGTAAAHRHNRRISQGHDDRLALSVRSILNRCAGRADVATVQVIVALNTPEVRPPLLNIGRQLAGRAAKSPPRRAASRSPAPFASHRVTLRLALDLLTGAITGECAEFGVAGRPVARCHREHADRTPGRRETGPAVALSDRALAADCSQFGGLGQHAVVPLPPVGARAPTATAGLAFSN
jgi:hypothetical protein